MTFRQARREWRVPLLSSGEELEDPAAYFRSVVRVFPDFAETVLWFVNGPVDYSDARLTEPLVADMRAWEDAYYAALDDQIHWKSQDLEVHHYREGLRLARALSDELGDSFDVEVLAREGHSDGYKLRIRGQGRGSNPRAVAAFKEWAAASEAEDAHFRELRARGGSFYWAAYAPIDRMSADTQEAAPTRMDSDN